MNLTAEQIQDNWVKLMSYISKYISDPRRGKLIEFYNKFQDRLMFLPASHKKIYHNAIVGGYCDHVNRVIQAALDINEVWVKTGVDVSTYTMEELVFSALNHDLGKLGDEENDSYIPQTDNWRREKLGEEWMFNTKLSFASVPDRGLFLLQSHGVTYTFNEMITIQTHDGLYDEANKKYLMGHMNEQKPRTALPFIVHQADLMAARIEWERENLSMFQDNKVYSENKTTKPVKSVSIAKKNVQQKALGSVKSTGLQNMLKDL